ncbi:putative zinc transporter msc2 [Apophysomyces ossiformis]|uniref:Putative zinc transporter msc2 n=1 Tax=Apophysomyces ossiformis TaxID=679940 RepID=A0A8H7BZ22_9FUNG|nr:putative zinc transporter msc2 [Apophysomyces ossiformis]
MQGVFLHIMADTLGSVGVIVSTLLIQWFGWTGFDPIASLFIAVLIVLSVIPLIKQSAAVLMLELDDHVVNQVEGALEELKAMEGVARIDMPRFWPNEAETLIGSLHVLVKDSVDTQDMRRKVTEHLMSHIDGLKELCVQVELESSARQNRLKSMQHHTGFFHTPAYPVSSSIASANYRSSAIPLPTFANEPANFQAQPASAFAPPPPSQNTVSMHGMMSAAVTKQTKKE